MTGLVSTTEDFNTASTDINLQVGRRLSARRRMLRLSQDDLGKAGGVSSQQVWKYENGLSGMKASRLVAFGALLDVPVAWFFEDIEEHPEMPEDLVKLLRDPRAVELLRCFNDISSEAKQQIVLDLAIALNEQECPQNDLSVSEERVIA